MNDLDKALADILEIRSRIAAGADFRGYGPSAMAVTGALALAMAAGQSLFLPAPSARPLAFFSCWILVACLSAAVVWIQMRERSRRRHGGLADEMVYKAIERFLPAACAGAAIALALAKFAPESLWLVPGLWQVFVSLGIFASAPTLPPAVRFVGAWYFVAGCAVVIMSSVQRDLSPWTMGVPFVVGQFLMAGILHVASGESDAEE